MKTKHSFLLLLLTCTISCRALYSQDNKIEYFFSEEVNKSINARLSLYKESEYKFYIIIGNVLLTEDCGNYQIGIGTYKDTPGEATGRFLEHSSHYYKYGTSAVPVIFDHDFAFAFFGKDSKGRITRINTTGNNYVIEFDRSGKIIREGL